MGKCLEGFNGCADFCLQACANFPQGEQCGSLLDVFGCCGFWEPSIRVEPVCSVQLGCCESDPPQVYDSERYLFLHLMFFCLSCECHPIMEVLRAITYKFSTELEHDEAIGSYLAIDNCETFIIDSMRL
jgi:hypothetical protein